MAATTAEGEGNRFIAIAVETSEPVPLNDPGQKLQKGQIPGARYARTRRGRRGATDRRVRTFGTHRILQTTVDGKPRTGELYNYVASFDTFLVIVTANPLVLPDKPVAPVDHKRARDLLDRGQRSGGEGR